MTRFNGGSGETYYEFDQISVSDGRYHTVTCIKDSRRIRIQLDDEYESPGMRLPKARIIEAPSRGGLYIGGTRKLFYYNQFVLFSTY